MDLYTLPAYLIYLSQVSEVCCTKGQEHNARTHNQAHNQTGADAVSDAWEPMADGDTVVDDGYTAILF